MERLQKVIAQAGIASRRKAEELITNGKVKVNGIVVTELGTKVSEKDQIEVNNEIIEKEKKEYYLLNKPRGVVTTTQDDKNRRTVVDLIPTAARIYPVGRLDYDTTGVLLLTNDGEFANILMHPTSNVDKVYMAKLAKDAMQKLTELDIDAKLLSDRTIPYGENEKRYNDLIRYIVCANELQVKMNKKI